MLTHQLIEGRRFAAEYGNALSNHLPMALIACARIGGSADDLSAFASAYTPKLEAQRPAESEITQASWREHLGRHTHNSEYREFFARELERLGTTQALRTYLAELAAGLSGGAFHPAIRLAFSLEAQDVWETAEALASWAMAYQELGPLAGPRAPDAESPEEILAAVGADPELRALKVSGDTLHACMAQVAACPAFAAYAPRIRAASGGFSALARAGLTVLDEAPKSFLALHLVTSAHAYRKIGEKVAGAIDMAPAACQAMMAGYVVIGCPALAVTPEPDPGRLPAWEAIFARARRSTNDHDAKFCFTAFEESEAYGGERHRRAAARRMGLYRD